MIYVALGIEKDGALAKHLADDDTLRALLVQLDERLAGAAELATEIKRSRPRLDLNALRDQMLGIVDADEPTEPA